MDADENVVLQPSVVTIDADCALVLVNALIPAGSRKGDLIDLEVTLPPGSKATSLHGGYLQLCDLRDYSNTKNLTSDPNSPERWLGVPDLLAPLLDAAA